MVVPDSRLRALRHDVVADLAKSIAEVGLLNPISVTPGGELVAGRHRLEACRSLGWADVPSTVVAVDDANKLRLAEIDENLVRADLTELERGEHMAERKRVYEAMHPTAPRGRGGARRANDTVSFAADTAVRTGIDERTVQRDVQVGSMPAEVRDAVRDTPVADRKRDLIELARMEPEQQATVAAVVADGAPTVAEAVEVVSEARAFLYADDEDAVIALAKELREKRKVEARASGSRPVDDDSWSTPDDVIARARRVLGTIDLDPATNAAAQARIGATAFYTAEDDGLAHEWAGRVWMNPPYSHPLVEQFTGKLLAELDAGRVTEAIVLLNNASDTRWMQRLFRPGAVLCLVKGRIRFVNEANEPAMSPRDAQFVLYFGHRHDAFAAEFGEVGALARFA